MSEVDSSRVFGPLTPTYMPYFLPHHSPLHSSSNTRQRDDYELGSQCCPSSPSLQVLVTSEDDEDYDAPPTKPDRAIEGYPASELPFASEPALESELEQGLPPLKKLKPDSDFDVVDGRFDKTSAQGIVLIGAVKGILTRRPGASTDSSSIPHSPMASSPVAVDTCFIPWSRSSCNGTNSRSTLTTSSAPLSRRSSSGASSVCAGSLKAVRFASGNLTHAWGASQQAHSILPGEVEGPVAAVMYLTHSAEAYDRSPIIVEDGLRLPPRARPEDDVDEPSIRLDNKRRAKLNVEILKIGRNPQCESGKSSPLKGDCKKDAHENEEEETTIIIKTPTLINKLYREAAGLDEEEEEEIIGASSFGGENEIVGDDDDDDEVDHSVEEHEDDEDESEFNSSRSRGTNSEGWGLGNWSSGEVFGCCDALGGF